MKNNNTTIFLMVMTTVCLLFTSCKKESENIFNMFDDVKVTFHDDGPNSVTDYKLLNVGDDVRISYTITSAKYDMFKIAIDSTKADGTVGTRIFNTKDDEKRSYSGVITFKMNRDGKSTFRIYAYRQSYVDTYIGDGGKKITVEGRPSFTLHANRILYADVTNKDLPTFYSISKGEAFSYNTGKANSADIDFGISALPRIYNLNAPNPVPEYNTSDWQKRGTVFSAPIAAAAPTFNNVLVSGQRIEDEAKTKTFGNTITTNLAQGQLIYFKTPEGKYGAILVNSYVTDYLGRKALNISVKTQK